MLGGKGVSKLEGTRVLGAVSVSPGTWCIFDSYCTHGIGPGMQIRVIGDRDMVLVSRQYYLVTVSIYWHGKHFGYGISIFYYLNPYVRLFVLWL